MFAGVLGMGAGGWGQGAPVTTLVEPPAPLLPAQLGELKRVADGDAGDGLGRVDGEDAAVLREDGLRRFARSEYTQDGNSVPENRPHLDNTQHGTVTVYEFGDVSGAVAAFDYFRTGGLRNYPGKAYDDKLADQAALGRHSPVFRSGVNVVVEDINRGGGAPLQELIAKLPKVGGRRALAPLLPSYLPAPGLERDSARYALGPSGYQAMGGVLPAEILGWEKSAEAITASYSERGGKGILTLLLYPTPQIAGDRGRAIEKMVNDAGPGKFGTVKLRRVGPLVGMVSGGMTAAQAEALIGRLHLNEEVSFDKKMPLEFHAEVRKTASLLQNIAVLCGVLILAAVLLGLFLGGARAGIRVLQGKPAATEPEFLTINLRDEPKALFAGRDGGGAGVAE